MSTYFKFVRIGKEYSGLSFKLWNLLESQIFNKDTVVWVCKRSPRNLKVMAFQVLRFYLGTPRMKPHFVAVVETCRKPLIFKDSVWSPGRFASPSGLLGDNALSHVLPQTASSVQDLFPKASTVSHMGSLGVLFLRLSCELFEVGSPHRFEVCAFGMHGAGIPNTR